MHQSMHHSLRPLMLSCLLLIACALPAASLTVAYNEWAGFAPVFVAQQQGFFAEAGVEVELIAFPGPGDSLAPLVAGHLDVSLTTLDNIILLAATTDAQVRAISVIDASLGADALVAIGGIDSVSGLKGKTVAVTEGEVNHLLLLKALASADLTEADISLVNMNPDDAGAALVAGSVDAAVTWEPWVSQAVEAGGTKIFTSADAPNLLLDVVTTTEAVIAEKSQALAAFLAGLEMGVQFLRSQPDQAYALAGTSLGLPGADVQGMLDGVTIYSIAEAKPLMGVGTDTPGLMEPLRSLATFLQDQGKIGSVPDLEPLIDPQFLSE
jgi:NitT/TauT family transport system substrate-binding protein